MKIQLHDIIRDAEFQIRAELDEPTISKYEECYREGSTFPPLLVWAEGGTHILLDGFHRHEAMNRAGFVFAEVKEFAGTKGEAMIAAVTANSRHGRQLSGQDMRVAIAKLLRCGMELSNAQIADAAGCSDHTVKAVRDAEGMQTTRVKGRDGKSYPSSVKRQPRGEDEDKGDRDDENEEPPPDPGLGGDRLSPEELAKDAGSKMTKAAILALLEKVITELSETTDGAPVGALMTVKAWIKSL
jgi:hypothetical protein